MASSREAVALSSFTSAMIKKEALYVFTLLLFYWPTVLSPSFLWKFNLEYKFVVEIMRVVYIFFCNVFRTTCTLPANVLYVAWSKLWMWHTMSPFSALVASEIPLNMAPGPVFAPVRGFWSWFGGVCSLTYCNGNFRVTMVSEPFNVIL